LSLGKSGELFAKKYFESLKYDFIEANYKYERAEIDLIFKDDKKKVIVFVEVKTRRTKTYGEPEESVTEMKLMQIYKAAEGYVMENPIYEDYEKRFDIASVMVENGAMKMNHLENAF